MGFPLFDYYMAGQFSASLDNAMETEENATEDNQVVSRSQQQSRQ